MEGGKIVSQKGDFTGEFPAIFCYRSNPCRASAIRKDKAQLDVALFGPPAVACLPVANQQIGESRTEPIRKGQQLSCHRPCAVPGCSRSLGQRHWLRRLRIASLRNE
jgi:hypothetical protein